MVNRFMSDSTQVVLRLVESLGFPIGPYRLTGCGVVWVKGPHRLYIDSLATDGVTMTYAHTDSGWGWSIDVPLAKLRVPREVVTALSLFRGDGS